MDLMWWFLIRGLVHDACYYFCPSIMVWLLLAVPAHVILLVVMVMCMAFVAVWMVGGVSPTVLDVASSVWLLYLAS